MTASSRRLRVIQWATGAVGTEMIKTILDYRADLQLVGARVYSDSKNGIDVGTLVGRNPVGVNATTDVADILAMEADLVLYAPSFTSLDDVCALLESGKNVATVSFLFHPSASAMRTVDGCWRPAARATARSTRAASTRATYLVCCRSRCRV